MCNIVCGYMHTLCTVCAKLVHVLGSMLFVFFALGKEKEAGVGRVPVSSPFVLRWCMAYAWSRGYCARARSATLLFDVGFFFLTGAAIEARHFFSEIPQFESFKTL